MICFYFFQFGSSWIQKKKAPLFRVHFIISTHGSLLLLVAHRIILDEQSLDLLGRQLCQLHEGETLSPPPVQFHDFAAWQTAQVSDAPPIPLQCTRVSFFDEQLKGNLPVLQLPIDFPRPPTPSFVCHSVSHRVSTELEQALRGATWLSAHEDPFLEGLFLSLFQVLLYRYSAEADIIVGACVSGRPQAEVSTVLGPFENYLPIRLATDDNVTFAQVYV